MSTPMDPIQALLEFLKGIAPNPQVFSTVEGKVQELFASFALVPKHEYEAHLDVLTTLKSQVADLETRLKALEN